MIKHKISNNKSMLKTISTILFAAGLSISMGVFAKDSLYTKGQKQLDSREWNAAQQTFKKLSAEKGSKQDAALYWLAYSQFKNNQSQSALKTISKLNKDFPKSRWIDDAKALKIEIADSRGEPVEIDDDEMKLYAINSLMNSSSEKTVPILAKIITGKSSDKIKKRALFVLSQSNKQEAYELITKLASDDSNATLQKYAIHTLGVSGSKKATSLLKQVYDKTKNKEIKLDVIKSYMVSGNSDELIDIARSEKDAELKSRAIRMIGVMSESDVLLKMYQEKAFVDNRMEIIKGIAVGGGGDALFEIIKTEKDEELLLSAIKSVGIVSSHKTGDKLTSLYAEKKNKEIRFAIIRALFVQSNAKGLVALVKQEKDPELKRKILRNLSMMGSDESNEYFAKILEGEG